MTRSITRSCEARETHPTPPVRIHGIAKHNVLELLPPVHEWQDLSLMVWFCWLCDLLQPLLVYHDMIHSSTIRPIQPLPCIHSLMFRSHN